MKRRLLVTAASESYYPSLLALLGSVRANWLNHPPIKVYDIGLSERSRAELVGFGVKLEEVPEFCPHWRKHYTWKLWILKHAPGDLLLWLDAGMIVLEPLSEIFEYLERFPVFCIPNYQPLSREASERCVYSAGLTYAYIDKRGSISGNVLGFNRSGSGRGIIEEAYHLAMVEGNIRASLPQHKHDQALLSCVLYKQFPDVMLHDGQIYGGWMSPSQVPGQKLWAQRRGILAADIEQLRHRLSGAAGRYSPRSPSTSTSPLVRTLRKAKSWMIQKRGGALNHGVR